MFNYCFLNARRMVYHWKSALFRIENVSKYFFNVFQHLMIQNVLFSFHVHKINHLKSVCAEDKVEFFIDVPSIDPYVNYVN